MGKKQYDLRLEEILIDKLKILALEETKKTGYNITVSELIRSAIREKLRDSGINFKVASNNHIIDLCNNSERILQRRKEDGSKNIQPVFHWITVLQRKIEETNNKNPNFERLKTNLENWEKQHKKIRGEK